MTIKNVTMAQLKDAARKAKVVLSPESKSLNALNTRFRVRLSLLPSKKWQARSASSYRRTAGVCFHGHLAFFVALAKVAPTFVATVNAPWMRTPVVYTKDTTMGDFERVGATLVGNMFNQRYIDECCSCDAGRRKECA